jgi:hypothetical protein
LVVLLVIEENKGRPIQKVANLIGSTFFIYHRNDLKNYTELQIGIAVVVVKLFKKTTDNLKFLSLAGGQQEQQYFLWHSIYTLLSNSCMAKRPGIFPTFFISGFECSTFLWKDKKRRNLVVETQHDRFAMQDYELLRRLGIAVAREGIPWPVVDQGRNLLFCRISFILPRIPVRFIQVEVV